MKLTTSNVVTGNISLSRLSLGNTLLSNEIQSLSIGDVSFTPSAVTVGNVSVTPVVISTPELVVGGTPFVGGMWPGIINYQEFTTSSVWFNPYANAAANASLTGNEQVLVMAWGGGGGSTSNNNFSQGGGGGACVIGYYTLSQLANTISVTVGTGGAGSRTTTTSITAAANGTNSVFASLVATGGGGATATGPNGGGGGGYYGVGDTSGNGGAPLGGAIGNPGGTSTFGGGGGGNAGGANGGSSVFGGGGGTRGQALSGGLSIYGGGGGASNGSGAGSGGTSSFGGNGGNNTVGAGGIPGGGAGANNSSVSTGGRGEVRVWVFGTGGTTTGTPTYTITGNTSLIAGGSETYTITTTNVPNNATVYYTLNNFSQAVSSDFTSATDGSVIINSGVGTFTLTANSDADTANETFYMDARVGGTSGTIVANSQTITILPPASIALTDSSVSYTSTSTYTFTNQSLGTASSDRYIIVTIGAANGQRDITSVTVAGITATQVGQIQSDGGGTASSTSGIYIAAVPTGTTGNIVVTFTGSHTGCAIGVYAVRNLKSATPLSVVTVGPDNTVTSASATLTTKVSGFVIATAATKENGITGWTWTNATENYDLDLRGLPDFDRATAGATATTSSNGSVTVTATSTTGGSYQVTFVAASFQ